LVKENVNNFLNAVARKQEQITSALQASSKEDSEEQAQQPPNVSPDIVKFVYHIKKRMTEVQIIQPISAKPSSQPQVGSKPKAATAHPRRMITGGGQGRRHPRRQITQNPQFHLPTGPSLEQVQAMKQTYLAQMRLNRVLQTCLKIQAH